MTYESASNAIFGLVGLAGITYLLFWRYRIYRVDKFRQEMFALRDELFDQATSGLLGYDHPAYGMLRSTMNGFIRFGHKFNLWQLIFTVLFFGKSEFQTNGAYDKRWLEVIEGLNPETKQQLEKYKRRMELLAVWHLIWAAPELYPFIFSLLGIFIIWGIIKLGKRFIFSPALENSLHDRFGKRIEKIDSAAFVYGGTTFS